MLAYANGFNAPFVYDDTLAILENETIRRLWPLSTVLWPQAEGGLTVSGRPVLNLSLAINHAISGTQVWSYHVFNILLHAGSAWLLLGIARHAIASWSARSSAGMPGVLPFPGPAAQDRAYRLGLAVTALWALHPLLTQAVTYTIQRAEGLMGFLYLLTLGGLVRATSVDAGHASAPRRRRAWLGVSIAACLLGMGTKEVMATAPLMVLLYDRTFVAGSFASAWRLRHRYYLALATTWIVLAILVLSTGGNRGGTVGIGTGVPLWAYPLTQFEAIARYLGLALWPHPLVFEYGTFWVNDTSDLVPHALVVVPLLAGTILALRRWPAAGFCGAWFFVILAPTSLTPGTIQMVVEHRMYLPLSTVMALAVCCGQRWLGRCALPALLAAAIAMGVLTHRRNHDYRSALALWSDTVAKRPANPRAHDGLAETLSRLGRMDDAIAHRREAVRLLPYESRYHYNLALTLASAQQRAEAIHHYQQSLQLAPGEARTHNNLAILHGEMGDEKTAVFHYGEAVRLEPANALYHYNHGVALLRSGRHADAAASFETALELRPDHAEAHFNLATALMRLNRVEAALTHYAEAARRRPGDVTYRITLGDALLLAKRPDAALDEYQRALAAQPDSIDAALGVANALAAGRRPAEAVAHYEAVLRRTPMHPTAHYRLGDALLDLEQLPRAVEHYKAALRITPAEAEVHHNLGVAYARMEQWQDARTEFETALRLKPEYPDARRHLEQLKDVLGR
jgi:tetratricopeptide (TPR) repeat protein